MKHHRSRLAFAVSVILLQCVCLISAYSQEKIGCFDSNGRLIQCGEIWVAEKDGVVYDCTCNCSGPDECTPRSQPSANDQQEGQREENSVNQPNEDNRNEDNAASEAENKRQNEELEKNDREKHETFEREHDELVKGLKRGGTGNAEGKAGSKTLELKKSDGASKLGLKTGTATTSKDAVSPQMRRELLVDLSATVQKRIVEPNLHAEEILRSLKTKKPPSLFRDLDSLVSGDIILVSPIPFKDREKYGWGDVAKSQAINLVDKWGSDNWSSDASHAAVFLGVRNGKRWYLDNTTEHGPVIIEEREFMRLYGSRQMDVATLVGEPISEKEGREIWKTAHDLRNTKQYGIWSDDKMVCSESSRWVLVSAGRDVPERKTTDVKLLGAKTGLNKKDFVHFSPADFYDYQQYFIIHRLGN